MQVSACTQVCAVIGDPVEHSLSPLIHNAAFRALGLDVVYVGFHVARGRAGEALHGMRALGIRGLSVTIPHKLAVMPHLDAVEEMACRVGSVNTIVNDGGRLTGYSTDGPGALRALAARGVDPAGQDVLVLGSGGAARAIAFALAALTPRPRLTLLGVDAEELGRLAADLRSKTLVECETGALTSHAVARAMDAARVVIHATPVGMAPRVGESLVPVECLRPVHAVFDAVYTPRETQLLKDAGARGATVIPGLGMFVNQAALQFELWTGRDAPLEVMTAAVTAALGGAA